jgi:hypothetical protein
LEDQIQTGVTPLSTGYDQRRFDGQTLRIQNQAATKVQPAL